NSGARRAPDTIVNPGAADRLSASIETMPTPSDSTTVSPVLTAGRIAIGARRCGPVRVFHTTVATAIAATTATAVQIGTRERRLGETAPPRTATSAARSSAAVLKRAFGSFAIARETTPS